MRSRVILLLMLAIPLVSPSLRAASGSVAPRSVEPGFPVRLELPAEQANLALLRSMAFDIDAVFDGWARLYVTEPQLLKLQRLGYQVTRLAHEAPGQAERAKHVEQVKGGIPTAYHTYDTLTTDLQEIAAQHPDIVRLSSIGQSVQGRELWMVRITDNPDVEEDEPEFAYISSIHGDEVVGKELCFRLIQQLTEFYGFDNRITSLVDNTEIWIMPSANPDGTALGQRWNANGIDLNRNFPDFFRDPFNSPIGREPETQHIMAWSQQRTINLKANLHGGAMVANYPFDNNEEGLSVFSPTPDNDLFVSLARSYADNNPEMVQSNDHPAFDNGITNGAEWFAITGGMQDWAYTWNGTFEILVELSRIKWPPGNQLPGFWDRNVESLLTYMERVHEGIRGIVTDVETGEPVAAELHLAGNPFPTYTDPDVGDYHRILLPGDHDITISAVGYESRTLDDIHIEPGPAQRMDFSLLPLPVHLEPTEAEVTQESTDDLFLDPGDTGNIAVTVTNLGRDATNVRGHLVPTGWFATAQRRDVDYNDVGTAELAVSSLPHHGVTVSPDAPPGHKIGFALEWSSDQGSGVSAPFFIPLGAPQSFVESALDLPVPVADLQSVESTIEVDQDLELVEVRVSIDIEHTYVGDLKIDLIAPSGIVVTLHNQSGGAGDGALRGTFGGDLLPVDPLAALEGEFSEGSWTLRISDLAAGDSGILHSWSLRLTGRTPEARIPELRLRGVTKTKNGGIRMQWWPYPRVSSYRVYRAAVADTAAAFQDVTELDSDAEDTVFVDATDGSSPLAFYLVTGVGPRGEGVLGHFDD